MDQTPAAVHPDEWRELPDGESRILVGKLCYADRGTMQLGLDEGGAFNIDIAPPMFSDLDMMLNPLFMLGVRRAILAKVTPGGWSTADAFSDVQGHGCTTRWTMRPSQAGPDLGQLRAMPDRRGQGAWMPHDHSPPA